MTTTSDHIETALDQLALAFESCETSEDRKQFFRDAARVHSRLALAAAIRDLAALQVS